jgi:hypothetical protein
MTSTTLEGWLLSASADARTTFAQIDVDQILGSEYTAPWDLGVALGLYHEMLRLVAPERWIASLVLPLRPSDELSITVPTDLAGDLSEWTPPGLCLMDPRALLHPRTFEEYHLPLDEVLGIELPPSTSARYSCYRTAEGRASGWEWERVVWIDRWPM